jgi:hypothetical protein
VTGHDRVTIHQSTTIGSQSAPVSIIISVTGQPKRPSVGWPKKKSMRRDQPIGNCQKPKPYVWLYHQAACRPQRSEWTVGLRICMTMQTGNRPSQIPENTAPEALIRRSAIYRYTFECTGGKGSKMYPLLRVFSWKMRRIYIRRSPKGESGD